MIFPLGMSNLSQYHLLTIWICLTGNRHICLRFTKMHIWVKISCSNHPGFQEDPLTAHSQCGSCLSGSWHSIRSWAMEQEQGVKRMSFWHQHQSLLSIWCTHFWFCPLVVLSIFILLNVDIYWYSTQSSRHCFLGHKVGKYREKWPKGRRNEAEKGKQHDWCYQGRGRKPWQTHLYGWLTDLQDV